MLIRYLTKLGCSRLLPEMFELRSREASLFQALSQRGRSKKRMGDKRDQLRAGSSYLYQTPLVARPLFQSPTLTESLKQANEKLDSIAIPYGRLLGTRLFLQGGGGGEGGHFLIWGEKPYPLRLHILILKVHAASKDVVFQPFWS